MDIPIYEQEYIKRVKKIEEEYNKENNSWERSTKLNTKRVCEGRKVLLDIKKYHRSIDFDSWQYRFYETKEFKTAFNYYRKDLLFFFTEENKLLMKDNKISLAQAEERLEIINYIIDRIENSGEKIMEFIELNLISLIKALIRKEMSLVNKELKYDIKRVASEIYNRDLENIISDIYTYHVLSKSFDIYLEE